MPQTHIERYWDEQCLLPVIKAIGQSRQVNARTDLHAHREAYFEIHLIMDGSVNWWVEDETYVLRPDSVYITKPGELHGGIENTVQPCTLTWLQIDPAYLDDPHLKTQLNTITERTWLGAHALIDDMTAMLAEVRNPRADSKSFLAGYVQVFLAKLLRQYHHRKPPQYPEVFMALLTFIDTQVIQGEVISVDDLSAHVNMSRSRVFQLFNQYAGQSPLSYISLKRIERAQHLLHSSTLPITSIAHELGFASSQHFATTFKRFTGMTPRKYRKDSSGDMTRLQSLSGGSVRR